jgi:hypothetical protein
MVHRPRLDGQFFTALYVAVFLLLAPFAASSAAAAGCGGVCYAPVTSDLNWRGIYGYVQMPDAGTLTASQKVADWINIIPISNATQWMQAGAHQGGWLHGTSYYLPDMYWENVNVCHVNYGANLGYNTGNELYFINYTGTGAHTYNCGGDPYTGYTFEVRLGCTTCAVVAQGTIASYQGKVEGATELGNTTASQGTAYFGSSTVLCQYSSYGIHRYNGSSWSLQTTGASGYGSNPPYLLMYDAYWCWATY